MKLVIFFGILIIALLVAVVLGNALKYNNWLKKTTILSTINLILFGSISLWWFLTESDGISQMAGVFICMVIFGAFIIIDGLVTLIRPTNPYKAKEKY